MQTLSIGAEAIIYRDQETVIKDRVRKCYRHPQLDEKLRGFRTRREAKVLQKLQRFSFVPKLVKTDESQSIVMSFIPGKRLRDVLTAENCKHYGAEIGKKVRILHDNEIIHGDLTTSNMIAADKANELFLVDFGLSFFSLKVEDKAVDLHLLKQTLEGKHHTVAEACFSAIISAYNDPVVFQRLLVVERRGRNKQKW